jgi:Fe-S-cluster containining protein
MNKNQKLKNIIDYGGDDVEVTRITNIRYRIGYCSRCGSCCKNIDISSRVSEYVIEWLKGYGIGVQVKDNIFESPDERSKYEYSATLSFPITCKHLSSPYTAGGIAKKPMLGIIGESDQKSDQEVVIPLPINMDIPVTFTGKMNAPPTQPLHTCKIHNNRPVICKLYPRKSSKWPTCTFVFLGDDEMKWFINEWEKKHGKEKKIKFIS